MKKNASMERLNREDRLKVLIADLQKRTDSQLFWVESVVRQFGRPTQNTRNEKSDLVTPCVLETFSDALQIHHSLSNSALTKETFEYTLERTLNICGIAATKEERCNPGHDITIRAQKFSLKTQANKGISKQKLHISKFMELGGGRWEAIEDFSGLRSQFFRHMESYERILQLRRIANTQSAIEYELVEIPKSLLLKAEHGKFELAKTRQKKSLSTEDAVKPTAPSGYCHVYVKPEPDEIDLFSSMGMAASPCADVLAFSLYFDGAGERKLQIKNLQHRLCIVHANWRISPNPAIQVETMEPTD